MKARKAVREMGRSEVTNKDCGGKNMDLTKKALEEVRFKSKGRWYDAKQVDDFIDEVIEGVEQNEKKLAEMQRDKEKLEKEITEVEAQLRANKSKAAEEPVSVVNGAISAPVAPPVAAPVADAKDDALKAVEAAKEQAETDKNALLEEINSAKAELDGLTERKDKLADDIKLLNSFKEQFKETISKDIDDIKARMEQFSSDSLL